MNKKSGQLTIDEFKSDYSKLVIRIADKEERQVAIERLIKEYYSHIESACREYMKKD